MIGYLGTPIEKKHILYKYIEVMKDMYNGIVTTAEQH